MKTITKTTTSLPSRITDRVLKAPNAGSKHEQALKFVSQRVAFKCINVSAALKSWDNEETSQELNDIITFINVKMFGNKQNQLAHNYTIMALERIEAGIVPKNVVNI